MSKGWPTMCKGCGLQKYFFTVPDNCPSCKSKQIGIVFSLHTQTDSDTAGFSGYNEGLGVTILNRGHWKKEVKRQNVRPVG